MPAVDLATWGEAGPFGAAIRGNDVHGRGTCKIKAGLTDGSSARSQHAGYRYAATWFSAASSGKKTAA